MFAKQRSELLGTLLGKLGASLLENILTSKGGKQSESSKISGYGVMTAGEATIRASKATIRAGQKL